MKFNVKHSHHASVIWQVTHMRLFKLKVLLGLTEHSYKNSISFENVEVLDFSIIDFAFIDSTAWTGGTIE